MSPPESSQATACADSLAGHVIGVAEFGPQAQGEEMLHGHRPDAPSVRRFIGLRQKKAR